jgi:hypothetical protein
MEKMSYSLVVRFNNPRSPLLVSELLRETNSVALEIIGMQLNLNLRFQIEPVSADGNNPRLDFQERPMV